MSFMRCICSGVMFCIARGHLVDVALHQLLAELVEQLPRTAVTPPARSKSYSCSSRTWPARSGGQHVELHVALARRAARRAPGGADRRCRSASPDLIVERPALLVDDVAQLLGDVVVHAAEVVLLEQVRPPAPQLLHQLPQALQPLAVAIPEAALHHAPQRVVEIAVVEQVVGDLLQDAVGVELEADLGAVPPGVREPAAMGRGYRRPEPPRRRRPPGRGRPRRSAECELLQALGPARPVASTAMRVPRTFVFVDLSGFTNYTAEHGDDAAGRLLCDVPHRHPARSPPTGACGWPSGWATAAWSWPSTRRTCVAFALDLEREATAGPALRCPCASGWPPGTPCCSRVTTTSAPP